MPQAACSFSRSPQRSEEAPRRKQAAPKDGLWLRHNGGSLRLRRFDVIRIRLHRLTQGKSIPSCGLMQHPERVHMRLGDELPVGSPTIIHTLPQHGFDQRFWPCKQVVRFGARDGPRAILVGEQTPEQAKLSIELRKILFGYREFVAGRKGTKFFSCHSDTLAVSTASQSRNDGFNFLRKKIEKDFSSKLIYTQVGMGYVLKETP